MPIPAFILLVTLAPAACGVLIAALGFGRRALASLVLGLAVLGALIPAVGMLILAPALDAGGALFFTILGGTIGENDWFSPAYRVDSLGVFAALGIAFIVAPLLIWMAWQRGAATEATADLPASRRVVAPAIWAGLALALGVETTALTLVFADNVLWLALAWLLLTALAWGLGEVGSEVATLDRPGLGLMLGGPILWTLFFFIPAITFDPHNVREIYPRFTQMMGDGAIAPFHALALVFALALAAGAYPFITWVRARAALITPAGLAALVLGVLPIVLFVGARTYSAAQTASNQWQEIGKASPPITAGLFFALVGAVTVAVAGLLALDRRDARALIAYLAVAQVGWGLIALGTGTPAGIVGLVALLATTVFGLGALLATLYSAGAITSDIEPDAAGPRIFGAPIQPLRLAAWCAGTLALLGAPLGAGFVARQLISTGAVQARGLPIPLTAIAWAGDALLGLALLRATAPAFTAALAAASPASGMDPSADAANAVDDEDDADASLAEADDAAASISDAAHVVEPAVAVGDDADDLDEIDEIDEIDADERTASWRPSFRMTPERALAWLGEAPAALLALLAMAVAVAPQALLAVGAIPGASALLQPGAANAVAPATLGYAVGPILVLPTLAWVAFVVLLALRVFLVPAGARQTRPVFLAGQPESSAAEPAEATPVGAGGAAIAEAEGEESAPVSEGAEPTEHGEEAAELVGLPASAEAWHELAPAFSSVWTLPGGEWLLKGIDDEPDEAEAEAEEEELATEAEAEPEELSADEAEMEEEDVEAVAEAEAEAEPEAEEEEAAEEQAEAEPEALAAMEEPEIPAAEETSPVEQPEAVVAEQEMLADTAGSADEPEATGDEPEAVEGTDDLAELAGEELSAEESSEPEADEESSEPETAAKSPGAKQTSGKARPARKPRKQTQKPARSRERATTRSRKRGGGGRA